MLVRKVLKELGIGNAKAEIPDISDKIEDLREEIEDIKRSEPYSLKYLVEDEEAARNKKDGIAKETEEYRKYRKELGEIILKMIAEGGLHFRVE